MNQHRPWAEMSDSERLTAIRNRPPKRAPILTVTAGLPASGKTTWANTWVERVRSGFPETGTSGRSIVRMSRDDYRHMFGYPPLGDSTQEKHVTTAVNAATLALLDSGVCVVRDDTNLRYPYLETLRKLARSCGAEFEIVDFTEIPVETCIERNRDRDDAVPEEAIRGLAELIPPWEFPFPPGVRVRKGTA